MIGFHGHQKAQRGSTSHITGYFASLPDSVDVADCAEVQNLPAADCRLVACSSLTPYRTPIPVRPRRNVGDKESLNGLDPPRVRKQYHEWFTT